VRGGRWRKRLGGAVLALVVGGCTPPDADTFVVIERIPMPEGRFASLHSDGPGSLWLSGAGEIVRVDGGGRELGRLALPESATGEFAGGVGDHLYVVTPLAAFAVSRDRGEILAERQGASAGAFLPDARGRFVLGTTGAGAVIGYDPATLEPIWGWGAIGARGTGLALSPEGDRLYQGVAAGEGDGGELLVRDVQTGRVLGRRDLEQTPEVVLAGQPGVVIILESWAGRRSLEALQWGGGELRPRWRRTLTDLRIEGAATIRISPDGSRLAVVGLQNDEGLHVLDVETGETIDRFRITAVDVAFGPGGEIYLLTGDGELTRIGRPAQ
jgi:hypothetical protein